MTRPIDKILQFARSSERGKTERVGGSTEGRADEGKARFAKSVSGGSTTPEMAGSRSVTLGRGNLRDAEVTCHLGQCSPNRVSGYQAPLADSLWSSSHINAHKRPNGTFINGPEAMDSIARGVILTVLLATLAGLGFWLCWGFSQAENAIIHRLGK